MAEDTAPEQPQKRPRHELMREALEKISARVRGEDGSKSRLRFSLKADVKRRARVPGRHKKRGKPPAPVSPSADRDGE